ncbi:gamma-glutamyltransferase family protein [Nonomuraea aridisoli]|uniref:Gamma-glutamyltranspeptidase n=1 Tax=Nonomuraea aridisoli TaxID=2070368 RepID=A0A2W2F0I7_9ACTN|nr:gamma-glutamyltransferase [Nonomuraea aridisoli]PZG21875.1 gamma-glutamyltranspeptidase [Nonomuraea aridisoli]
MTPTCAIATPHALATAAADAAVRRGGNAIDAALAAAVTLTVVYPHNTALGGDLIALVRTPDGRIVCVNASGPAPAATDPAAVAARHGGRLPVSGPDTITVPGAVAGWAALHRAGARLDWAGHFTAATAHAAGVAVAPGLAAAIAECSGLIAADAGMRAVFSPGGRPLTEGQTLRQEALGATLAELAADGPDTMYGGRVGARLTAGLRALGSPLTLADLASYRAEPTAPLCRTFRGHQVYTSPPNTHGFLLLQALGAVARRDDGPDPLGDGAGRLARIFHRGIRDRGRHLGDPRFAPVDVDALLDPGHLDRVEDEPVAPAAGGRAGGDTVAVVTADTDGYAVSLIQSLFHSFGSGVLEPSTGMLLHNRGSFFSLDPGSPNLLAPGKRPAHTLMPVMVTEGDRLAWVLGTMGGKAQPQIHTQVLLRLLAGASTAEAVAAPRWVVGGMEVDDPEDTVSVEADAPARTVAALAATGAPMVRLPAGSELVGHAQVVALTRDGAPSAESDPRSDGAAVVTRGPLRHPQ